MKHHVKVKLYQPLDEDLRIPDWQDFITDKSFIKEDSLPAIDRLMSDLGLKFWVTREYDPADDAWGAEERKQGLNRTYRLILQEDFEIPPDLAERIRLIPTVEKVRKLEIGEAPLPAPQLSNQSSIPLHGVGDLIYLPYAKAMTRGLSEIKVAVLDTGVSTSHPELSGRLGKGADFVDLKGLDTAGFIGDYLDYDEVPEDEVGHGSHVSGIIAAKGLQMEEGVCPNCTIIPVRVLATMKTPNGLVGAGIVDNINTGIKWAVDAGVDVINMSLGVKHGGGGLPHEDVIRYALSKNVTVVAASGNDGTAERYYPGALPGVIAVGAVDDAGAVTSFSSYGANITVVAPGVNIYSCFANSTYAFASGTSQASPFVCGTVALMKSFAAQRKSTLSHADITYILRNSSDRIDTRMRNEHAGYGLINLADAFKLLTHLLQ